MLMAYNDIRLIFKEIDAARTFPPQAYYEPSFFETERKQVFFGGWAALCLSNFVVSPGDAAPIGFLGAPLIVTRSDDGAIRVFHNLCPYDQAPILMAPVSGTKELISAYHGWVYDLEGRLVATPYRDGTERGGVVPDHAALLAIESREYLGVVFINLDGARAAQFDDYIAPLEERYQALDMAAMDIGRDADGLPMIGRMEWRGNWKTHHENACINVYHETAVHDVYRQSTHVPRVDVDGKKQYEEVVDRGLRGLAFTREAAGDTYIDFGFPNLPTIDGAGFDRNVIVSLYPNLYASVIGQHLHLTIVTPTSPEAVEVMTASYFAKDTAQSVELAPLRAMIEEGWRVAGAEDEAVIAAIQAGRRSPAAEAGFYAPFWDRGHWDFNKQVARDLGLTPDGNG